MQMSKIQEILKKEGFKLTPQRQKVITVILEKEEEHLSAEEIFLYARRKSSEIGLATVYRTLEILVDLHIVNRISFADDGVVLYDLRKEEGGHFHSHLRCKKCRNVEEIEEDILLGVEEQVFSRFGFTVTDHHLTFEGICAKCS